MGKNKQNNLLINITVKRQRTIDPRKNNRMIYLNLAAPAFRKIKTRKKEQQQQIGKGLASNLIKAGFDLGS